MQRSELINELIAALTEAHKEFEPVLKETENPAYRGRRYADMASVVSAIQPSLSKHGISIIQFPISSVAERQAGISTILAHKSGQYMESSYMLPAIMPGDRFDAQACGSALTYARRYAYLAICGVAPEDDDGNAAAGIGSKEAAKEVARVKLAAHGGEYISMNEIESPEGTRLLLSGGGVAIMRAEMTGQEKGAVDWLQQGPEVSIAQKEVFAFQAMCEKKKVDCTFAAEPMIPKSHVPDMAPVLQEAAKDPLITKAQRKTGKKGPYLAITWDGIDMNIFGRSMTAFENCFAKQIPVFLEYEEAGKFTNFKRMVRMNGVSLTDEQMQAPPNGIDFEFFAAQ